MLNFISNNDTQNNFQSLSFQHNDQKINESAVKSSLNKRSIEDLSPESMVKHALGRLCQRALISHEERAYYENIIKNNGYPTISKPSFNSMVSSLLDSDDSFIRNKDINLKTNSNLIMDKNINSNQQNDDKIEKLTVDAISKNTIEENKMTFSPIRDELIPKYKPVDNNIIKNPEVINDKIENNKTNSFC